VAEPRTPLHALPDAALEDALRELARGLAVPAARIGSDDAAARARRRIVEAGGSGAPLRTWRVRRSLILAVAALLVVAAVAAAVGLGLPGLRFVFGETPPPEEMASPAATAPDGPPGSALGLGTPLSLDEAERRSDLAVRMPTDPTVGSPDAVYLAPFGAVSLVWAPGPGLPATDDGGVGLLVTQFRGGVDDGYVEKTLRSDAQLTPVTVDGGRGHWIAGPPHFFVYVGPDGEPVEDSRRIVGDTLVWTDGDVTYRLESSLGMQAAIRLAETLE
jgi:hypothetical protein